MKPEVLSSMLVRLARHKSLRRLLLWQVDRQIYKGLVNPISEDPHGAAKEISVPFCHAALRCKGP
jgi:hypothetical protein